MAHIRDEFALHPVGDFRLDLRSLLRFACPLTQHGIAKQSGVLAHQGLRTRFAKNAVEHEKSGRMIQRTIRSLDRIG